MDSAVIHRLLEIWRRPDGSAQVEDPSRLGLALALLFITGAFLHGLHLLRGDSQTVDLTSLISLILLAPLYLLNHAGRFHLALGLTIALLITLAALPLLAAAGTRALLSLYYLILVILVGGLFLPFRLYLVITGVALAAGFLFSLQLPDPLDIPGFELGFSLLFGLVIYHERSQGAARLTGKVQPVHAGLSGTSHPDSRLRLLEEIARQVTDSLDETEILQKTLEAVVDKFGYAEAAICLLVGGDTVEVKAIAGTEDLGIHPGYTQKIGTGIVGHVAETGETHLAPDVSKDAYYVSPAPRSGSAVGIPILDHDQVLGVLYMEDKARDAFTPEDIQTLQAITTQVAIAIEYARLHSELNRLAWTDALSGLANRRAFDAMLEAEIARAQRYDHLLSLIIMDIDSFKEYNDRWGHLAGDERLKQLAAMLRQAVREPDITARYGGEEFAVILPNTGKDGAVAMAERLRLCAEAQSPLVNRRQGPISGYTISLGVASYPQDAVNAQELLLAADNAELTAKRMGKNRVFSR